MNAFISRGAEEPFLTPHDAPGMKMAQGSRPRLGGRRLTKREANWAPEKKSEESKK